MDENLLEIKPMYVYIHWTAASGTYISAHATSWPRCDWLGHGNEAEKLVEISVLLG